MPEEPVDLVVVAAVLDGTPAARGARRSVAVVAERVEPAVTTRAGATPRWSSASRGDALGVVQSSGSGR